MKHGKLLLLPISIIPFIFYFLSAAPDIGLGDTALLADQMQKLNLNSHVNNHNWTILIGHLFTYLPLDSLAFKGTLSSVFQGGIAIILFYLLLRQLSVSCLYALLLSAILMVSHSFWWHSTLLESYAGNAIFVLGFINLIPLLLLISHFIIYDNTIPS